MKSGIQTLQSLASNLETILLTYPNHEKKEAIAFVAGTAHSLIHKIIVYEIEDTAQIFENDTISYFISAIILFLISNSQADAAEMALQLPEIEDHNYITAKLRFYIQALASGNLKLITDSPYEMVTQEDDIEKLAYDYLWREIGLGIYSLASKLLAKNGDESQANMSPFDRVIDLAVSETEFFDQKSIFTGPYHLAKLLKILEFDILERGVINIPPPSGIDAENWNQLLEKLAVDRPYLWENHRDAVATDFLNPGVSAVLTFPTGAGKSTLSELKIMSCILSGKNVVYLVPTHALEDQVKKNLKQLFNEFSLFDNDINIDGEYTEFGANLSPIMVMTPERCITQLNINSDFFDNVGLVVFDEFHLIHGTNIEKDSRAIDAMYCLMTLFATKPKADYLLISAMVENGDEIKYWIESVTNRPCELFNSSWKPTRQLHGCLVFDFKEVSSLRSNIRQADKSKAPGKVFQRSLGLAAHCYFSLKNIWESDNDSAYSKVRLLNDNVLLGINKSWRLTTNRNDIAARLGIHYAQMGIKTLIFVDDPRIAHSTSLKIGTSLSGRDNSYKNYLLRHSNVVESLTMELGDFQHSYFYNQVNSSVHHGLLLSSERMLIEHYFKESDGSIVLVATATLAQGINLPAEIVIIAGDDRFDEDSKNRETLPAHELLNAAGRAGRAGQSSQGAVILIPGVIVSFTDAPISDKWDELKDRVFSKSDQCLKVEDPIEYFLDSIQSQSKPLSLSETNILYKFKPDELSDTETKHLLSRSFYAYKANKNNQIQEFDSKVNRLIERRNDLNEETGDILWIKEISHKTGLDPNVILALGMSIDKEEIHNFLNLSIVQYIDWFFDWLYANDSYLTKIFTKFSTINQIKKAIGLPVEINDMSLIIAKLPLLKETLKAYVSGKTFKDINDLIPDAKKPDSSIHLKKARNFILRLVPELSFSFGLLVMIALEKANQNDIDRITIPSQLKFLATCIREGFDTPSKLYYKYNNNILMRVETHQKYDQENNSLGMITLFLE